MMMCDGRGLSDEIYMVLRSPARNEPRSGLLQMSGGRVFQTLAVRGKKECLKAEICLRFWRVGRFSLDSILLTLLIKLKSLNM